MRHPTHNLAIITPGESTNAPAAGAYPVQMVDLSIRGARFVGQLPLKIGDRFVLHLPVHDQRITMLCEVAHKSPTADDQVAYGAEFVPQSEPTALAAAGLVDAEVSHLRSSMMD